MEREDSREPQLVAIFQQELALILEKNNSAGKRLQFCLLNLYLVTCYFFYATLAIHYSKTIYVRSVGLANSSILADALYFRAFLLISNGFSLNSVSFSFAVFLGTASSRNLGETIKFVNKF